MELLTAFRVLPRLKCPISRDRVAVTYFVRDRVEFDLQRYRWVFRNSGFGVFDTPARHTQVE